MQLSFVHRTLIVKSQQNKIWVIDQTCWSETRLVAEIEVGGWPVPEITWFKDGEELVSKTHTENWNGYPNKYVPEASLEVIQVFY